MGWALAALLTFSGKEAQPQLVRAIDYETWNVGKRKVAFAADFSAPLAMVLSRGESQTIDIGAMFRSDVLVDSARLLQFPIDDLELEHEVREVVKELVYFTPRGDVDRVVFMVTPHRDSPLALRSFASFFANIIRLPISPLRKNSFELLGAMRDNAQEIFRLPNNSIRFLHADSPLLLSILNLPLAHQIPLHTIIGNRKIPGPIKLSSDGIVPYWSSHLPMAASEIAVPSGHGVNEKRQGIEELGRILRQNLTERKGNPSLN